MHINIQKVRPYSGPFDSTKWSSTTVSEEIYFNKDNYFRVNLYSVVRIADTITTGSSGNIGTTYVNDGYNVILAAWVNSNNYKVDVWVSGSNNYWYLTVRDAATNATINSTSVQIRYVVARLNSV